MKSSITREEFSKEVSRLSEEFAEQVWQSVMEAEADVERCDEWMRGKGSEYLREVLGKALSQRSERLGVSGTCECGGSIEFRQHRPFRVHTVLAGRDVELSAVYAQCCECRQGKYPLLEEMRVDQEGFTQALQELSLLAGVIEPYRSASEQLLRKFTGVVVSSEKIQSLVRADGKRAEGFSKEPANEVEAGKGRRDKEPRHLSRILCPPESFILLLRLLQRQRPGSAYRRSARTKKALREVQRRLGEHGPSHRGVCVSASSADSRRTAFVIPPADTRIGRRLAITAPSRLLAGSEQA